MITIAVCEDEPYFAEKLENLLRGYLDRKSIRTVIRRFINGETLMHSTQEFDIILMDIKLPGEDGINIMRRLRANGNQSQLIFITAFPEYVFHAFEVDAVHYLLKPVTAEVLCPILDKALKRAISADKKAFLLEKGGTIVKIQQKDILCCEAMDHQITIHTTAGTHQFFGTLDAVQGKLDERFFRCHRSYLVNLDAVSDLQPGAAVLSDGTQVLIARRRQQAFMHRLLESCRKGL